MKRCFTLVVLITLLAGLTLGEGILAVPKEKLAFPYDIAGFGAWIKLSETPDFEVVGSHFEQILQVSDNHILGWTTNSGPEKVKVYIYADVNGYLVTFLDKDMPPSAIIDFSYVDFSRREVKTFTILAVMQSVLEDLGYDFAALLRDVKFADFQHQDANAFFVALSSTPEVEKFQSTGGKNVTLTKGYLHVAVSNRGKVYSYSFAVKFRRLQYNSGYYNSWVNLYVDENSVYYVDDDWQSSELIVNKNSPYVYQYPAYYTYLYYLQGKDEKILSRKYRNGKTESLTFSFDPLDPHTFSMRIDYWSNYNRSLDVPIWGKVAVVVVYRK